MPQRYGIRTLTWHALFAFGALRDTHPTRLMQRYIPLDRPVNDNERRSWGRSVDQAERWGTRRCEGVAWGRGVCAQDMVRVAILVTRVYA